MWVSSLSLAGTLLLGVEKALFLSLSLDSYVNCASLPDLAPHCGVSPTMALFQALTSRVKSHSSTLNP